LSYPINKCFSLEFFIFSLQVWFEVKFSVEDFKNWRNKKITLVGMSGVGKTYISSMLQNYDWFHYSGDYRIGTRYLDETILDMIKSKAMEVPFLQELLRKDWIYIRNNIKISDLGPVLSFVGKLGNPEQGGVELEDFQNRQAIYREAEISAMQDVPSFIEKAKKIYGYKHFINDVGGSLCELNEPSVIKDLAKHTLILYIKVTDDQEEKRLISRAQSSPKPLYYRPDFLLEQLDIFLKERNLEYAAQVEPDDFTSWIFPRLFHSRVPRYEEIAKMGYTVTSEEIANVSDEKDFLELIEEAIEKDS
tara:strand:- start:13181 stop:14095 length:915 start_codon:yes stop_codon:yes gene_type:complete